MRVSLINLNLIGADAIGSCIINQVRFFQRRGDDVRVYVCHPPEHVPADVQAVTTVTGLRDLIEGKYEHFALSDLYMYHYPGRYPLMETIRGIDRGVVVFYYHNVTPPELWGNYPGQGLLVQGLEGSSLVHYADFAVVVSPFSKQDLVEQQGYASDRILVLPLAVALDRFAPGDPDPRLVRRLKPQGSKVLLFVGRMANNKRIDLLVEALVHVRSNVPNTRLILVGDHDSNPAFRGVVAAARTLAEKLGVSQDVVWTGRVEDLPSYYHLADAYVTASLHEGFGVPLIEAMACGVPIVASHAGAMPWVVGDAGLLCEPGSAQSLAKGIARVLEDNELRNTLVERGLQRASMFSLEQYEQNLTRILEQIIPYPVAEIPGELGVEAQRKTPAPNLARERLIPVMLADEIEAQSDVALRDYVVRSGVPLLGPFIVWVRRNLTSHLREPYLDPIIERQVAFNRRVAEWVNRVTDAWKTITHRQDELEERVGALESQVEALLRRLDQEEPDEDRQGCKDRA